MNRGHARIVAIVVVVAMIVALAAAAISGGGDDPGADGGPSAVGQRDAAAALPAASEAVLRGPHVQVNVCNGGNCPAASDAEVDALAAALAADPRVADVEFVSAERAYALFLEEFADDEELASSVDPGDVPARFEVDLLVLDSMDALAEDLRKMAGVEDVIDLVATRP